MVRTTYGLDGHGEPSLAACNRWRDRWRDRTIDRWGKTLHGAMETMMIHGDDEKASAGDNGIYGAERQRARWA